MREPLGHLYQDKIPVRGDIEVIVYGEPDEGVYGVICQVSEDTKEKAKVLFGAVDAKTLGDVEQELIQEGVSHEEIRRSLCDIHLEVLRDSLISKRVEV